MDSKSATFLMLTALVALLAANSPWGTEYLHFWEQEFTVGFANSDWHLTETLHHWINDGLVTFFFFVIGLEVKREVLFGELSDRRRAIMPIAAAIGGSIVPIALFFLFGPAGEARSGWGIPIATDVAFSLGILQMAGKRVPTALKVFLVAYAVIDDLVAVLLIALFYSDGIDWQYVMLAGGVIVVLGLGAYRGYYHRLAYVLIGILVWLLFLKSGIHPTLAGVLLGVVVPLSRNLEPEEFLEEAESVLPKVVEYEETNTGPILAVPQIEALDRLRTLQKNFVSPVQHLEHFWNGFVAYAVLPIFALANAGVVLSFSGESAANLGLALKIGGALVFGKFIGIFLFSWLALKTKLGALPQTVSNLHLASVSCLGGLGFTMALFIANLSYDNEGLISSAKIGILAGSTFAGLAGYFLLKYAIQRDSKA